VGLGHLSADLLLLVDLLLSVDLLILVDVLLLVDFLLPRLLGLALQVTISGAQLPDTTFALGPALGDIFICFARFARSDL
jgi:hypothetical protein